MRHVLIALLLPLLAACAPGPVVAPSVPAIPTRPDTCGAAAQSGLLGRDATALERVLILGQVRLIRPGDAVTQDYSPQRINFEIDAGNVIRGITCG